jgi:hypothetical protein
MPLANLLNQPKTDAEWSLWAWAHYDQHTIIRQAIQAKYSVALNSYPIQPIDLQQPTIFLNYNQELHDDFNGVLGTRGSDLLQVDLNNPAQFQAWINLHYQEHYTASAALKVT